MTEEEKMMEISAEQRSFIIWNNVPYSILDGDIDNVTKTAFYAELNEINGFYEAYEFGTEFRTEGSNGDYVPSDLRFRKASSIMEKEVRFMFSTPPDFTVNCENQDESTKLQELLNNVLSKSNFNSDLIKACKDCFIGKRIAIVVNFNEESGIKVLFFDSLSFVYKIDPEHKNRLEKFVYFYNTVDTANKANQRWYKKSYDMENGYCYFKEEIYDGLGSLIETVNERKKTSLSYIPAYVVLNDGLTGDLSGRSELGQLLNYESVYSGLANGDIDAERKGMNPTKYTIDASEGSTANLSTGPGSYWDIQSDDTKIEGAKAQVGILNPNMGYSEALKTTLDRVENAMYSQVDVPNVSSEKLQGVLTSGKTISALYWSLSVRCDEKMLTWIPAFVFVASTIIEGAKLYKDIAKMHIEGPISDTKYNIVVENNYALPEDTQEEKNMDLSEVAALTMSKKQYMKKWRHLTDEEADEELLQIKKEQDLFDNSQTNLDMFQMSQDDDLETLINK